MKPIFLIKKTQYSIYFILLTISSCFSPSTEEKYAMDPENQSIDSTDIYFKKEYTVLEKLNAKEPFELLIQDFNSLNFHSKKLQKSLVTFKMRVNNKGRSEQLYVPFRANSFKKYLILFIEASDEYKYLEEIQEVALVYKEEFVHLIEKCDAIKNHPDNRAFIDVESPSFNRLYPILLEQVDYLDMIQDLLTDLVLSKGKELEVFPEFLEVSTEEIVQERIPMSLDNRPDICEEQERRAMQSAKNNFYEIISYGYPRPVDEFDVFFKNYLRLKHGIHWREGGCVIRKSCYSSKMDTLIEEKFGVNWYQDLKKSAKKIYQSQNSSITTQTNKE